MDTKELAVKIPSPKKKRSELDELRDVVEDLRRSNSNLALQFRLQEDYMWVVKREMQEMRGRMITNMCATKREIAKGKLAVTKRFADLTEKLDTLRVDSTLEADRKWAEITEHMNDIETKCLEAMDQNKKNSRWWLDRVRADHGSDMRTVRDRLRKLEEDDEQDKVPSSPIPFVKS